MFPRTPLGCRDPPRYPPGVFGEAHPEFCFSESWVFLQVISRKPLFGPAALGVGVSGGGSLLLSPSSTSFSGVSRRLRLPSHRLRLQWRHLYHHPSPRGVFATSSPTFPVFTGWCHHQLTAVRRRPHPRPGPHQKRANPGRQNQDTRVSRCCDPGARPGRRRRLMHPHGLDQRRRTSCVVSPPLILARERMRSLVTVPSQAERGHHRHHVLPQQALRRRPRKSMTWRGTAIRRSALPKTRSQKTVPRTRDVPRRHPRVRHDGTSRAEPLTGLQRTRLYDPSSPYTARR